MSVLDQLKSFNQTFRGDPAQRSKPIRQTGGDASVMEEVQQIYFKQEILVEQ